MTASLAVLLSPRSLGLEEERRQLQLERLILSSDVLLSVSRLNILLLHCNWTIDLKEQQQKENNKLDLKLAWQAKNKRIENDFQLKDNYLAS